MVFGFEPHPVVWAEFGFKHPRFILFNAAISPITGFLPFSISEYDQVIRGMHEAQACVAYMHACLRHKHVIHKHAIIIIPIQPPPASLYPIQLYLCPKTPPPAPVPLTHGSKQGERVCTRGMGLGMMSSVTHACPL